MIEGCPIISCPNHPGSQIALVNLDRDAPKGERMYCLEGCTFQQKVESLSVFVSKWKTFSKIVSTMIEKQKYLFMDNQQFVQKTVLTLRDEIYNQLTEQLNEFENQTNQVISQYEKKLREFDSNPKEQIKQKELLEMIENYLKPQYQHLPKHQSTRVNQENLYNTVKEILNSSFNQLKKGLEINYEFKTQIPSDPIRVMAFSPLDDIMIAGCQQNIKVYNITEGILEERALLEGHEGLVVALCYSKFRDYFVSGGKFYDQIKDSTLRVWERIDENQWENTHVLYNHNYSIEQIIFDEEEKQMISCDDGDVIFIWEQAMHQSKLQWSPKQTLSMQNEQVFINSICLNQANNLLAATSSDSQIRIWKKNHNNYWLRSQNLQVQDCGFRIVFIKNDSFLWQSKKGCINLFQLTEKDQGFSEIKNAYQCFKSQQCYWRFPSIYNQELKILVTKQFKSIYIFQVQEQDGRINLTKLQEIAFQSTYLYGQLSKNGHYLVGYDETSKFLQVFQLQEKVLSL